MTLKLSQEESNIPQTNFFKWQYTLFIHWLFASVCTICTHSFCFYLYGRAVSEHNNSLHCPFALSLPHCREREREREFLETGETSCIAATGRWLSTWKEAEKGSTEKETEEEVQGRCIRCVVGRMWQNIIISGSKKYVVV